MRGKELKKLSFASLPSTTHSLSEVDNLEDPDRPIWPDGRHSTILRRLLRPIAVSPLVQKLFLEAFDRFFQASSL